MNRFILFGIFFICGAISSSAQTATKITPRSPAENQSAASVKSSPAYAELLLRRTERDAELEELLLDYKEEFPKVQELRYELNLLKKEMDKVAAVKAAESGKLTLALGKLMLRKIEIEIDLWNLKKKYNDDQPEVQRTKRRIEVFQNAIKEILP